MPPSRGPTLTTTLSRRPSVSGSCRYPGPLVDCCSAGPPALRYQGVFMRGTSGLTRSSAPLYTALRHMLTERPHSDDVLLTDDVLRPSLRACLLRHPQMHRTPARRLTPPRSPHSPRLGTSPSPSRRLGSTTTSAKVRVPQSVPLNYVCRAYCLLIWLFTEDAFRPGCRTTPITPRGQ